MISIEWNHSKTGFVKLPGNLGKIVAHFRDGHTEEFDFAGFVMLRNKREIVKIDCYEKD